MRLPLERHGMERALPSRAGRPGRFPALAAALLILAAPALAEAQERRTLLDMLFGRRAPASAPEWSAPPPPAPAPRRSKPARSQPRTAAAPVTTEVKVEKREDARKVLVVGDFLASGLGEGLAEAFADVPGVVVVNRPNGSSGLVREDYYNWQQELPKLMDEVKPAAVIVLLGSNDRQQIELPGGSRRFRTEEWFAEYGRRASALAALSGARKVPLVWVGLPPFQSPSMTADAATLNGTLRSAAEKAGATFIDIWDGFADEAGKFVTTGSDINGKPARLRGTDGIGLSKAGKRKLAFYLEKPVKDLFGEAADPVLPGELRLDTESLPDLISLSPSQPDLPTNTVPMAVTDPDLDGGDELLGARPAPSRPVLSPRDLLVERGELPAAPTGRADNARFGGPAP